LIVRLLVRWQFDHQMADDLRACHFDVQPGAWVGSRLDTGYRRADHRWQWSLSNERSRDGLRAILPAATVTGRKCIGSTDKPTKEVCFRVRGQSSSSSHWRAGLPALLCFVLLSAANTSFAQMPVYGDYYAHDPSRLIKQGSTYYLYRTSQGIMSKYSTDLR